jgi:two-component system invasion response regulator UvrY
MKNDATIYIAYADEQTLIRKIIAGYITELDQRFKVIIEASNGSDLLEQIDRSLYQPDVCIFDICMPVMNGYDTVVQIKKKYPYVRCLALSNLNIEFSVSRIIQCGAFGYISKSADPAEIRQAIIEVYENNYYFSADILKKMPSVSKNNKMELTKTLLTDREIEFLSLCCSDLSYIEIGSKMHLSHRTIEHYCTKLCDKLHIESRIGLAMFASYTGIGCFGYPDMQVTRMNIP